jgi:hypothetical protein
MAANFLPTCKMSFAESFLKVTFCTVAGTGIEISHV